MFIDTYTGLPRQGKTIHGVWRAVWKYLRCGRRIISTTPMWYVMPDGRTVHADHYVDEKTGKQDYQRFWFECMNERTSKSALIFIDEGSGVFSSIKWSNYDLDWFMQVRQAGKNTNDMIITSQSYSDIVASLRRMVSKWFICKKSFWLIPFPIDFRRAKYHKDTGWYKYEGLYLHTPEVFDCLHVAPTIFRSMAARPETRALMMFDNKRMYPSVYRKVSQCYDHEYRVKISAVVKKGGGSVLDLNYNSFEEYIGEMEHWDEAKKKLSTINTPTISPPDSPNT